MEDDLNWNFYRQSCEVCEYLVPCSSCCEESVCCECPGFDLERNMCNIHQESFE